MPKNPLTVSWDECRHRHLLLAILIHFLYRQLHNWALISANRSALPTTPPLRGVTAQLTSQRDVRCEERIATFTHRTYYVCNNIVSLAVKHLWYNTTYDHEYDLTKQQQKLVTDVSSFISDMSRYLCIFHSRANFMQGIHKYFLPVVVQYILISISDRPTAFTSQDDGVN